MGIEVPQGDALAPPEQSKPETNNATTSSNTKKFVLVAVLISLVLAAVLIGVLPDWGEKKDNELESSNGTTDASKPTNNGTNDEREAENGTFPSISYLESSSGPFNVRIPLFSSKITEGYSSEQELGLDLEQLAKFLLNDAITTNAAAGVYSGDDGEKFVDEGGTMDMGAPEAAPVADGQTADSAVSGSASQSSNALDGVDSFNTNNQELSVDRADFVKSDGTYIYAAYGDYLVVWTIDGSGIISKIQMPPLNLPNWGGGIVDDPIMLGEDTASSGSTTETNSTASSSEAFVTDVGMIWWQPKPRIEALLLHEGRLTVVISGYGMEYADKLGYTPVLYDYRGTKIQVYDINDGNLQIVSEGDVNGSFRNAYSAGENAYVVTQSSINTWDYLLAPVQRWQPAFVGMDNETYVQAVVKLVDEGLVQTFVDELLSELRINGQIDLARLSAFTDSIAEDHSDAPLYSGGVANAVTQVVSFDMTLGSSTDIQPLSPHVAGTFHPGSWGNVYAVSSMIIVADQGWSWIPADNLAVDKTYLIGFRLDGPSSTHAMIGSVDGYLLNPFSLDFVEKAEGSYVRIATTQNFWTPWFGGPIVMEGGEDMVMEADSESVTQDVAPEEPVEPKSSTLNQIIVLKVPSTLTDGETVLEQVGSVELGEPNEVSDSLVDALLLQWTPSDYFFLSHRGSRVCVSLTTSHTPSHSSRSILSMLWIFPVNSRRLLVRSRSTASLNICTQSIAKTDF